jgi:hypothetical protein
MSLPLELCLTRSLSTLLAMLTSCLICAIKTSQLATPVALSIRSGRSRQWSRAMWRGLSKRRRVKDKRDHQDKQTHHHFASHLRVPPLIDSASIMCARTA